MRTYTRKRSLEDAEKKKKRTEKDRKEKEREKKGQKKERKERKKNETKTYLRSGRRPSPGGDNVAVCLSKISPIITARHHDASTGHGHTVDVVHAKSYRYSYSVITTTRAESRHELRHQLPGTW